MPIHNSTNGSSYAGLPYYNTESPLHVIQRTSSTIVGNDICHVVSTGHPIFGKSSPPALFLKLQDYYTTKVILLISNCGLWIRTLVKNTKEFQHFQFVHSQKSLSITLKNVNHSRGCSSLLVPHYFGLN